MRFYRICLLLSLLLLGACASIPREDPAAEAAITDFSRPNIYSVYHFLSGSFVSYADPSLAMDQYQKALSYDPASPQIKHALFKAKLQAFKDKADESQDFRLYLQSSRAELALDSQDLMELLQIYSTLQDEEGLAWVTDKLEDRPHDAQAMLLLYHYQYQQSRISDSKKIKRILELSEDKGVAAYALASIHAENDPDISLELLQNYPLRQEADELKLEILLFNEDYRAVAQCFEEYRYPEDIRKMQYFISRMQSLKRADLVSEHSEKILATKDKNLIAMLSELSYYADDKDILQAVSDFLLASAWEPQIDTQIAAVLIAYALHNEEIKLPVKALEERITSLSSAYAISHYYLYKNLAEFTADEPAAKDKLRRRIQNRIDNPLLANLLNALEYNNEEARDTKHDQLFAQDLIERNLAGKDEYSFVIMNLHREDEQSLLLQTLSKAVQFFPNEALFLNDLGYTLLEQSSEYQEAARYIEKAYELQPGDPSITDSMAWLRYKQGEYSAALEYAQKIKEYEDGSTSPEVLYHLGMIYLAVQDVDAAEKCLQAFGNTEDGYYKKLQEAIQAEP